ncbi:MAG: hypothetical protein M3466_12970 [Gemmatimonadota bacterium]|nr:hypothetical protein [Gemmatimonadota bacterium]
MRASLLIVHFAVVLIAGACGRGQEISGVDESTFVAAMAKLRVIEGDSTLDSAEKVTARQSTLQEQGLSSLQLESAARSLADDPAHALAIWGRIDSATLLINQAAKAAPRK